jgi:hypothetical protein
LPEVRQERTGWRDLELSQRHRKWGWDCPAVDLDFLFLEYDKGKAVAVVEYKNEHAKTQYASHPTYQAMIDLGNRANVPVFACRYTDDFCQWKVIALNDLSREKLGDRRKTMTEAGWVSFLYELRGYKCPQSVIDGLTEEI